MENLINNMNEENNKLVKEDENKNGSNVFYVDNYGAKGDGITDDSVAIENCLADMESGDYLMFSANKKYIVTKTLFIPVGVKVLGCNATIIPIEGNYINNYVFSVNSSDVTTWDKPYTSITTYISQLNATNRDKIINLKFLWCPAPMDITMLNTRYFYNSINTGSFYVDYFKLQNIYINDNLGDDYAIKKYYGDGTVIDVIHTLRNNEIATLKCLALYKCKGARINNLINGQVYIYESQAITLSNCHIESGNISIVNSEVVVDNCYMWNNLDFSPAILIKDVQSQYSIDVNLPVTIKNTTFRMRYIDFEYETNPYEIDISDFRGLLYIENSYRQQEQPTAPYKYSFLTGITVKVSDSNTILMEYNKNEVFNKILKSQDKLLKQNTGLILSNASVYESQYSWSDIIGNIYYNADIIFDESRLLGKSGLANNEKMATVIDTSKLVQISLNVNTINLPILRLYKGYQSGEYTKYVDIPNLQSRILIDNGHDVNGYVWKELTTKSALVTCFKYEKTGINTIKAYCSILGSSSITDTSGFYKGDVIVDLNCNNNHYEYVFISQETGFKTTTLS